MIFQEMSSPLLIDGWKNEVVEGLEMENPSTFWTVSENRHPFLPIKN
jgi:hypothetical protein